MQSFPTRNALITGAAKRIGRQIALALAADGWAVACHYNESAAEAEALVTQIKDGGGQACGVAADLREAGAAAGLVASAAAALGGGVSVLINNASLFERDDAASLTAQSWDEHLNTNLRAPALLMQSFAAQGIWEAKNCDGAIINITDQRVQKLTPDFTSYTISKIGLDAATKIFAQAFASKHIRVNAIAPGPVLPNPRQSQKAFDAQASAVPLQHGTSPEEIAAAVQFILAAKSMTGEAVALDGGQHLAWATPDVRFDAGEK